MLRVPRSPLFPYTTLFRSGLLKEVRRVRRAQFHHAVDRPEEVDGGRARGGEVGRDAGEVAPASAQDTPVRGGDADGRGADRKSTRLNSSHSQTSYAVFCLK